MTHAGGKFPWTGLLDLDPSKKGPIRAPLFWAEENTLSKPPYLLIRGENVGHTFILKVALPEKNKTTEIRFLTRGPSGFRAPAVGIDLKSYKSYHPPTDLTNHNELNQCLCFHVHFCLRIWINKITGKKKNKTFPETTHPK